MADGSPANFGGADGGNPNPVGDGADDQRDLDGAAANGEPGSPVNPASFKRGRGRPPGSGTKTGGSTASGQQAGKVGGQKQTKLGVDAFAAQIQGAHAMLALITKNSIWNITDKESMALAVALLDVMVHHQININPATLSYIKLIGALVAVHGSRMMVIQMANKKAKQAEKERTVDMPS